LYSQASNAKYLELESIAELDKHGNSTYLFMGAGDIQKYLNAFKDFLDKEKTA